MIDPSNAMESFQQILLTGSVQLQRGDINPDIFVHADTPAQGKFRLTYVNLDDVQIIAFVNFAPCEPIEGIPCLQIGYAVPKPYRNQGRAKKAIEMAILEMQNGYKRAGIVKFYIEAIVEIDNIASQRVAQQTISSNPKSIIDEISGLPAFQYLRIVDCSI